MCRARPMTPSSAPATSPARVIEARPDKAVFHIGPERDRRSSTGSTCASRRWRAPTTWSAPGLDDDDVETPEDYRARLEIMRARKLFMLCGNPDVVVERGDKLVYCAGAIADLYATMGGEVLYAGKPLSADLRPGAGQGGSRGRPQSRRASRVLAIGDSVRTDLKGARTIGIDCLFVTVRHPRRGAGRPRASRTSRR